MHTHAHFGTGPLSKNCPLCDRSLSETVLCATALCLKTVLCATALRLKTALSATALCLKTALCFKTAPAYSKRLFWH